MKGEGQKPDWELAWEAEQREVLAAASFSVFVPEGLRPELSGWGGGDGEPVEMVAFRHELDEDRWIEVDSELAEDDFHLPDAKRDAADRLEEPSGARIEVASRPLSVDGVDVPFAFACAGDRWVAIGAVGDVTITVQARGMSAEDLRLRALADPARVVDAGLPRYRPSRPDRAVLDSRRVADLARATPIADLGARLAGFARGGLALLVSEATESSWIGGEPELPADARWPAGVHGAMTFVAQLSLADLDPVVWTGPASGHLHVFCDCRAHPAGRGRPGHAVARSRIQRRAPIGRRGTVEARAASACRAGRHQTAGQLLGWPTWQNEDNMDHLASLRDGHALEWTLLLQTGALDAELYVVLPSADLVTARFDRAEATIEHD